MAGHRGLGDSMTCAFVVSGSALRYPQGVVAGCGQGTCRVSRTGLLCQAMLANPAGRWEHSGWHRVVPRPADPKASRVELALRRDQRSLAVVVVAVVAGALTAPRTVAARPACATLVAAKALPKSALTVALDPDKLPKQVCRKSSRSYTWQLAGSQYRYHTERAPSGGNTHGTLYTLDIEPFSTEGLRTSTFAFLRCAVPFEAHRYCAWRLAVRPDATGLHLRADDVAQPCKPEFTWASMMRDVAAQFRRCDLPVAVE